MLVLGAAQPCAFRAKMQTEFSRSMIMKHKTKRRIIKLVLALVVPITLAAVFMRMILYPISVQDISLRTISNLTLTLEEYKQSFAASGKVFVEDPFAQSDDLSDYCKISLEPELINHGFFSVNSISFSIKNDTAHPAIVAVEYFAGDSLASFEGKSYNANTVLFIYRGDYTDQEIRSAISDLTLVLQYKGALRTVYREIPLADYFT